MANKKDEQTPNNLSRHKKKILNDQLTFKKDSTNFGLEEGDEILATCLKRFALIISVWKKHLKLRRSWDVSAQINNPNVYQVKNYNKE